MSTANNPDVAKLIEKLASNDACQRAEAAEMLCHACQACPNGETPSAASLATLPLVRACGDCDERVREWAIAALEDFGPPPIDAIQHLVQLVTDSKPLIAYWAVTLVGRSGQSAASTVAALAACIDSSADLSVRQRAAWALGQIGPAAFSARPVLLQAAGQSDSRLALLASEALEAIGS
ncbi:MAG: HEAT repeat domain-containing protein [Planctomycetota bacterium]